MGGGGGRDGTPEGVKTRSSFPPTVTLERAKILPINKFKYMNI